MSMCPLLIRELLILPHSCTIAHLHPLSISPYLPLLLFYYCLILFLPVACFYARSWLHSIDFFAVSNQDHSHTLSLSLQTHVLCEAAGSPPVWQLQAQHGASHASRQSGQGAGEVLQGVLRLRKLRCSSVRKAHACSKDAHQRNLTQSL